MTATSVSVLLLSALLAEPQYPPSGRRARPERVGIGVYSRAYLDPPELQFGCFGTFDEWEDRWGRTVADPAADPTARLVAAQALWRGHSRRYAAEVLKYTAGSPPGGEGFRRFQREVDAAVRPDAVLWHLREGDYLWGCWLAFLRPDSAFVPVLLAALDGKADDRRLKELFDGGRPEATLALGNTGDRRALGPLLDRLQSKEYRIAGEAAQALGYLGLPEAEPPLIAALAADNNWRQVQACGALARMGTRQALPALERLAADDADTGALNVQGMARLAVERIQRRERR